MNKRYVPYEQIIEAVENLRDRIIDNSFNHIIGVTRGGLIPAVHLSNLMDIPLTPIQYSSSTGKGKSKILSDVLDHTIKALPRNGKILLIDDISDSGHTLNELVQLLKSLDFNITTFTIHYRETSVFKPDLFWQQLTEHDPWIVYPWEKE